MSFPQLSEDILLAPLLEVGPYSFKIFSIGERGTNISPELSKEVISGLLNEVNLIDSSNRIDSIVSIHVTGAMWASHISIALNKLLKLFTTEINLYT